MKRFRLWLREMTLTQQLLAIIVLFITIFVFFLLVFLSPQIDEFSRTEMYRLLHSSQENLIYYLNTNTDQVPSLESSDDLSVTQILYTAGDDSFVYIAGTPITEELKTDMISHMDDEFTGTRDFEYPPDTEGRSTGSEVLYCITMLRNDRYLISVMSNDIPIQFRKSLTNTIVNLNVMVVFVLFLLLLAWVSTLILPLGQIKNYITRIKNDEPASLTISRRDEIGEVAEALVDMERQLSLQSREKEEMIQNISHDLKTPIATIKSYGESIKDGIYPYDTLEKSVDVIIEHANRLEKKVHSLILLNKMGYLLDECPEGDTLDMNRIIDMVMLSLKVVRPEIRFETEIDPGIKFHGEEEPWRITVENLIENALRYARTTIRITLHERELCVINDGPPIGEDVIDTLFRPYEKGQDAKFGLGLSIVHKVCTTYGYKVDAENLAAGVSFRIWKEGGRKESRRKKNSAGSVGKNTRRKKKK